MGECKQCGMCCRAIVLGQSMGEIEEWINDADIILANSLKEEKASGQ